ncbi:MFS family permease [Arthrobacter pascens]|nr:MFS family permease [Arthrobacter pascens]
MTEQEPAPVWADPDAVDTSVRSPAQRSRTFAGILVNTALANVTTSYLWFALTFWVYLETRNVIATGVVGGAYMLLIALSSISFGTFVDRYRKLAVMRFAAAFTLVMFVLSGVMFLLAPTAWLLDLTQPGFWVFTLVILIGAVVENMRNIALSTTVTILIEPDRRANANGLVGMVQGLMFIVTSVLSGLSVGLLGMGWTIAVALALTALAFAHLLTLRMPEEVRAAATDAHGGFDLRGSLAAVLAVAGLFALILFSTFNNFIGGVYMALMDPYGLEMFPVELWGIFSAVGFTGILVGGALIGKFGLGSNPLAHSSHRRAPDGGPRCGVHGAGVGVAVHRRHLAVPRPGAFRGGRRADGHPAGGAPAPAGPGVRIRHGLRVRGRAGHRVPHRADRPGLDHPLRTVR